MTSSTHIFLIFNSFNLGGIQKKMIDLAEFVAGSKYKKKLIAHLIFFEDSDAFFLADTDIKNKYNIHFLTQSHWRKNKKNIIFIYKLVQLILKYQPIAIVSFLHFVTPKVIIANFLAAILHPLKTKIVISQDNILSLENSKQNELKPKNNLIISFFYKLADKIIVQSQYAQQDLTKSFNLKQDKIAVIPNWIPTTKVTQKIITKKNRPTDIVYLGRFAKQKRLIDLLKIVKLIKQKLPSVRVKIFGSGDRQILNQMLTYIDKNHLNHNIQLLHPTIHPDQILQNSKVLLLTSAFEGHPMVILEAMTYGCVVATKNYTGAKEHLTDKKSGVIFSSNQEGTTKIINLLRSDHARISLASSAYQNAQEKFDQQRLITQTLDVMTN